jgi:hypothetical protein
LTRSCRETPPHFRVLPAGAASDLGPWPSPGCNWIHLAPDNGAFHRRCSGGDFARDSVRSAIAWSAVARLWVPMNLALSLSHAWIPWAFVRASYCLTYARSAIAPPAGTRCPAAHCPSAELGGSFRAHFPPETMTYMPHGSMRLPCSSAPLLFLPFAYIPFPTSPMRKSLTGRLTRH